MESPPLSPARARPRQKRAQETFDRLLDVAGELLAEVGVQNISTNMICRRAGVTPPALYRYARDKHEVIGALAQRLMESQNQVLEAWLASWAEHGIEAMADHVDALLGATAAVTASAPGAIWILRSLRAIPQLSDIRLASHAQVTTRLMAAFAPWLPELSAERLRRRTRISVEFAYAIDEALLECEPDEREAMLAESARMLGSLFVVPPLAGA